MYASNTIDTLRSRLFIENKKFFNANAIAMLLKIQENNPLSGLIQLERYSIRRAKCMKV